MHWAASHLIKQAVKTAPNWWKHRPIGHGEIPTEKEKKVLRRVQEKEK